MATARAIGADQGAELGAAVFGTEHLGVIESYRLRTERRYYRLRAFRRRRHLHPVSLNLNGATGDGVLAFLTVRNGYVRLPYFLDYYRRLGITHFFVVDNGSTDGTSEYLADQTDVSLFHTSKSYKKARFGMDWLQWLLRKYGHERWCLTVDIDEFLVFPFSDRRPIKALTDWLDVSAVRSFGALMVDVYPDGPTKNIIYKSGMDPLEATPWFDSGNYVMEKNKRYWNLWTQGGPRARMFFADCMKDAPALNKIPLVKWNRRYAYVSSTHMLLPRGLNLVYDQRGGEKTSGCLMHAKFLDTFSETVMDEVARNEHYAGSREYQAYLTERDVDFWSESSERFAGWQQLETLGLMSKGNWA